MEDYTLNVTAATTHTSPKRNISTWFEEGNDLHSQLASQITKELVPISVVIVLANVLVFVLFCLRRNLRTAPNYFLIGLAFADFLTGAVDIPLMLVRFYSPDIGIDLIVPHFFTATLCAYHILVITGEKFFAIMKPLKRYRLTKKLALSIILLVWCWSSFMAFIQLAWQNAGSSRITQTIYIIFGDVVVFLLPYAFMICAYLTMFRSISRGKKKLTRNGNMSYGRSNSVVGKLMQVHAERKCLIIFALMAIVYAICWLPWFTFVTLLQFNVDIIDDSVIHAYVIIRYLTSAFNPIIYTFFKRDFNMALRSLLLRKSTKKQARETLLKYVRSQSISKGTPRNRLSENRTSFEHPHGGTATAHFC